MNVEEGGCNRLREMMQRCRWLLKKVDGLQTDVEERLESNYVWVFDLGTWQSFLTPAISKFLHLEFVLPASAVTRLSE